MGIKSAGILLYRFRDNSLELFLAHPGGPFWAKKDAGAWSIPKGEFPDDEDPVSAALREFKEETGVSVSSGLIPLTPIKQKSNKTIYAWAAEGDVDVASISSNTFELEWPPGSGKIKSYPEIDKAEWFSVTEAQKKILPGQLGFIIELVEKLVSAGMRNVN